jgi:hypothetical protein
VIVSVPESANVQFVLPGSSVGAHLSWDKTDCSIGAFGEHGHPAEGGVVLALGYLDFDVPPDVCLITARLGEQRRSGEDGVLDGYGHLTSAVGADPSFERRLQRPGGGAGVGGVGDGMVLVQVAVGALGGRGVGRGSPPG